MESYLQHLKSLRLHLNEYEDKAAALSAERHKYETAIRATESDIEAGNAELKRLDHEMDELEKQKGTVSMSIIKSQKEAFKLDGDLEALSQALDILHKDLLVQAQASKSRTDFFNQTILELQAGFEGFKSQLKASTEENERVAMVVE